jgi:endonuclease/exonuclease/phosphatase family metal-dependent hydrolase
MSLTRRTAFLLAICLCGFANGALAAEVSLRTMTFNVRYAGTFDDALGSNGWVNLSDASASRAARAIQIVRDYGPDIIGTQELLSFQFKDLSGQTLASGLTDYGHYGIGRNDGIEAGEYAAIFYRADRFTQLDAGTFWLSPTPEVAGSQYPGAGSIRIASWVRLDDHLSGQELFVLNTHLDNVSNTANVYAANLIRERLPLLAGDAPILLTGDMNSTESSTVVRTLLGQSDPAGLQLGDAYREVHPVQQPTEQTFHNYSGSTFGSRIDFILHSDALTPTDAAIVHTSYGGKYPSDHFPVTVDFTLAVVPEPGSAALLAAGAMLAWPFKGRRRR